MTTTNTKRIIYYTWKAPVGIAMASSLLPLAIIAIIARATGHEPITQVAGIIMIIMLIALPVFGFLFN